MHTPRTPQKAYKHLDILQFSEIKRVVNITEGPGENHTSTSGSSLLYTVLQMEFINLN